MMDETNSGGSGETKRSSSLQKIGCPTQLERMQNVSMEDCGILQISPDIKHNFTSEDLIDYGIIGKGSYGEVHKMVDKKTQTVMAVKKMRSTFF